MPKKYRLEFKRDVVTVARRGRLTIPDVAVEIRCLGGVGAALDAPGRHRRCIRDGQTSTEQTEIVQLRPDKRRLEIKNEIMRRAAAYFAAP